jgi:phosphonate transport system substrate-binding protein
MLNRRHLLLSTAGAAALAATPAFAQADWRARFPEIVFAVVPAENASGVTERFQPFMDYLARELRVRVTLRIANDYAAVIEGHRAGNIHIGYHGPSSYVRAWTVTNGGVEPFVTTINEDGSIGYFSVLYTRANNPATSIQDLRGRNLCLVDPNSASGNNVPRFAMDKMGINPEQFFGRVVYAGSHENAVTAVQQGTCDAAFNWWNSETDSNLTRMARRNMVRAEDFKIVFRSDLIPGSPYAFITTLPQDARNAIRQAFLDAPTKDKAAFDRLSDGKDRGFQAIAHSDFQVMIDLQRFVDQMRRRGS